MNAPTKIQIINGEDGKPAFVVIPYAQYKQQAKDVTVPHAVVVLMIDNDWTILRAWREHLRKTQQEIADRMGISQAAYSQFETSPKLRKASREKLADALGILPAQLEA